MSLRACLPSRMLHILVSLVPRTPMGLRTAVPESMHTTGRYVSLVLHEQEAGMPFTLLSQGTECSEVGKEVSSYIL